MKKRSKKRFKLRHLGIGLIAGLAMGVIAPLIIATLAGSAALIIGSTIDLFPERLLPLGLLIGLGLWVGILFGIQATYEAYKENS